MTSSLILWGSDSVELAMDVVCEPINHPLCWCATKVKQNKSPFQYNVGRSSHNKERKGDINGQSSQ